MQYTIERGARILPGSSWQPVMRRSVDAFSQGRVAEGRDACLALLAEPGLPGNIRELTYRNQSFYAQPLSELVAGAHWTTVAALELAGWVGREPSPVWAGERLLVVLRGPERTEPAGSGHVLLVVDDALRVSEATVLGDETGEAQRFAQIRPFCSGGLQAAVVVRPVTENGHRLAGIVDFSSGSWRRLCHFGPRAGDFRAGWSPVVTPAGPHIFAWWEPTEVFRCDDAGGAFARVGLRMAPHMAERFEGGSSGVVVPGGYLFLVNERVAFDEAPPLVFSRFVLLDESFQIDAISPQFFVADRGRDEASGLTRQRDRLVAGFTSGEDQPLLVTLDVESVLAMLIPVAAPGRQRRAAP